MPPLVLRAKIWCSLSFLDGRLPIKWPSVVVDKADDEDVDRGDGVVVVGAMLEDNFAEEEDEEESEVEETEDDVEMEADGVEEWAVSPML